MARVLIVGCGCRGRALAERLKAHGHVVTGTSRDEGRAGDLGSAGIRGVVADPDRLGTLLPHLDGPSVVCWLMGSAAGERDAVAALHGPRLQSLLAKLVDTHVRGLVYEAAGAVDEALLVGGAAIVRHAHERHGMPVAVVDASPAEHSAWTRAMTAGVASVLGR